MRGQEQLVSSARTGTGRDDWRTPETVLHYVRLMGEIDLDPCASENHEHWFAAENGTEDKPQLGWELCDNGLVYVNPPYSQCRQWLTKCAIAGASAEHLLALTPARTDTRAWQDQVFPFAQAICFWRGRITFVGAPSTAPFPSAVVYWGKDAQSFARVFRDPGAVVFP